MDNLVLNKFKNKTKTQLLKEITSMHNKVESFKAIEEKYRLQAEELIQLNIDIERKRKDLEILHTISEAVHQSFDLQHIYKTALDIATNLQDVDVTMIYLVNENRDAAVLQAYTNLPDVYVKNAGRITYPRGITWKAINSGKVLNIKDIQKNKDIGPAGRKLGIRRTLGIPIILEGVVMGVIWLSSLKMGYFSEQEIELNVSIGNQIGIAIAKAKLYQEMENRVSMRTAELEKTNLLLKQEIEYRKHAENEIKVIREQRDLVNSIKKFLKNKQYIDSTIAEKIADDVQLEIARQEFPHDALSNREYKVMLLIASGKSIKDIAKETYLSPSTVSTYRERILKKLNLKTTSELIRYAITINLLI